MCCSELLNDPLLKDLPDSEGYKVLGGVVLLRKLGQGGMGAVYRGKHVGLNKHFAMKIMLLPSSLEPDARQRLIDRFLLEARTAADINHSNLIRVEDVGEQNGIHFLRMEFIEGESAADRLRRKEGPLPEVEATQICLDAARGLAAAHGYKPRVVHRDVKPDNIMLDKAGNVKVTDLGLAKVLMDERATKEEIQSTLARI